MNIRFLETFIWVARLKSFSLAGERLNMSQTSVSHRIAKMEQELGTRLFKRSRGDVSLTRDGQEIFANAEAIVANFAELKIAVKNENQASSRIFIGASEAAALTFIPDFYDIVSSQFDLIDIAVERSEVINRMLYDREVDFAFSLLDSSDDQIRSIAVCDLDICWVGSTRLDLPEDPVAIDDLAAFPIIRWPRGTFFNQVEVGALGRRGLRRFRINTSAGIATMVRMVADLGAISLMTPALAQKELEEGSLRILRTRDKLPSARVFLSCPRDTPPALSRVMQEACRRALDNFSKRSANEFLHPLLTRNENESAATR